MCFLHFKKEQSFFVNKSRDKILSASKTGYDCTAWKFELFCLVYTVRVQLRGILETLMFKIEKRHLTVKKISSDFFIRPSPTYICITVKTIIQCVFICNGVTNVCCNFKHRKHWEKNLMLLTSNPPGHLLPKFINNFNFKSPELIG